MATEMSRSPQLPYCRQSAVSANVTEGVVERLRTYFLRHPNSRPKSACRAVGLDPRRYGATARVVKYRVRKMWGGANIQADPLKSLTSVHRQSFYVVGGVPSGHRVSSGGQVIARRLRRLRGEGPRECDGFCCVGRIG